MDLTSRFAREQDCQTKLGSWDIPDEWWSRKAEYPWAAQFVKPEDTVVDAACGIPHFFKCWLAEHVTHVIGTDNDSGILSVKHMYRNLELQCGDISHINVPSHSADVICCISVFEHVSPERRSVILDEFARIVKPDTGLVVLTLDVPTIVVNDYVMLVQNSKLKFAGNVDRMVPQDILISKYFGGLRVFMSVLKLK